MSNNWTTDPIPANNKIGNSNPLLAPNQQATNTEWNELATVVGDMQAALTQIVTCANIAALRTADISVSPVRVQGFATAGDGGEGFFFWSTTVPGSTQLDDNVGIVITSTSAGAGAGRWRRAGFLGATNSGATPYDTTYDVNARWFGAVGDGLTDDTAALQAAVAATRRLAISVGEVANSSGAHQVATVLPAGTYLVSGTIEVSANCGFRGVGKPTLVATTAIALMRLAMTYSDIEGIVFSGGLNALALTGPSVYGGFLNPQQEINAPCHITNCTFLEQTGPAIWHDQSPNTSVASGSNGHSFPLSGYELFVASNANLGASGTVLVADSSGVVHTVTFSGVSGSTALTGCNCADTSGTLATGGFVGIPTQARAFEQALIVSRFFCSGPCLYWGSGDSVTFSDGQIEWDWTSPPVDALGFPLGLFNTTDRLAISRMNAFGILGGPAARSSLITGTSEITIRDCSFGQQDGFCAVRARSLQNTYANGAGAVSCPLPPDYLSLTLVVDGTDLSSVFNSFWLEVYEQLPSRISLKNVLNGQGNNFADNYGIWLDQGVALPSNLNLSGLILDYDGPFTAGALNNGTTMSFVQGFETGSAVAPTPTVGTDVTAAFAPYRERVFPETIQAHTSSFQVNLFQGLSTDNTSFFSVAGYTSGPTADTTTGISLSGYGGGTSWTFAVAYNQIGLSTLNAAPGIYCFSFYVKVNYACDLIFLVGPSGTNTTTIQRHLEAATTFQRVEIPFYYPGDAVQTAIECHCTAIPVPVTAWAPTTAYTAGQRVCNGTNVYLCTASGTSAGSVGPTGTGSHIHDGSGTLYWNYVFTSGASYTFTASSNVGLWMVNPGYRAAPYTFSKASDSAASIGWVPRTYYGTAAPTQSTTVFFVGDVCWNTAPAAGQNMGWVCVTQGSPGTWKEFGAINA